MDPAIDSAITTIDSAITTTEFAKIYQPPKL